MGDSNKRQVGAAAPVSEAAIIRDVTMRMMVSGSVILQAWVERDEGVANLDLNELACRVLLSPV